MDYSAGIRHPQQAKPSVVGSKRKEIPLSSQLEAQIPESHIFTKLLAFERDIDSRLSKRRLEVQDSQRTTRSVRVLRLSVYNLHHNQDAFYHSDPAFANELRDQAGWTLRVEGRLLDEQPGSLSYGAHQSRTKPKFSQLVSKLLVELDKTIFTQGDDLIEWNESQRETAADGFEIRRPGSHELDVKLLLHLKHSPPQYKLSDALSRLLGLREDTRAKVLTTLWYYIKNHQLQDHDDRRTVINNPALREVFGCERMSFDQIPLLILQHLSPPDPTEIDYRIQLSGDPATYARTFDLPIQWEEPAPPIDDDSREIAKCDEEIAKVHEALLRHKRKHEFMLAFAADPVTFLNTLVSSQIRDYKMMHVEATRDEEAERHAEFFTQPGVGDAVQNYLANSLTTVSRSVPASPFNSSAFS
eukprot:TRINITY_DN22432_c0_g1_i1.p1 TRINITY_DN22432_c0_g1~~TRINITY_DN22432_c0_g1_i1.p1  ORF type:complete len:414 (-),score=125.49 TRINITY_DN22432_c0_g1_i1:179-1420(-)